MKHPVFASSPIPIDDVSSKHNVGHEGRISLISKLWKPFWSQSKYINTNI